MAIPTVPVLLIDHQDDQSYASVHDFKDDKINDNGDKEEDERWWTVVI